MAKFRHGEIVIAKTGTGSYYATYVGQYDGKAEVRMPDGLIRRLEPKNVRQSEYFGEAVR